VNNALLLAGAIPAGLLAICADFLLGLLERRLRVS
jgi:ABC-type proline/glycine betaine transport system permease subunit